MSSVLAQSVYQREGSFSVILWTWHFHERETRWHPNQHVIYTHCRKDEKLPKASETIKWPGLPDFS
jgi:hypothetical protein